MNLFGTFKLVLDKEKEEKGKERLFKRT